MSGGRMDDAKLPELSDKHPFLRFNSKNPHLSHLNQAVAKPIFGCIE